MSSNAPHSRRSTQNAYHAVGRAETIAPMLNCNIRYIQFGVPQNYIHSFSAQKAKITIRRGDQGHIQGRAHTHAGLVSVGEAVNRTRGERPTPTLDARYLITTM